MCLLFSRYCKPARLAYKSSLILTCMVAIPGSFSVVAATDDYLTQEANARFEIHSAHLLSNDSSVENPQSLRINYVDDWRNGYLEVAGADYQLFFFHPEEDFVGEASFVYGTIDDEGNQAYANVYIDVREHLFADNSKPHFTTERSSPLALSASEILKKTLNTSHVDTKEITYIDDWFNGVLSADEGLQNFVFTPNHGFNGLAGFTIGVSEPNSGEPAYYQVRIQVEGNAPPQAVDDDLQAQLGEVFVFHRDTLLANDIELNLDDELHLTLIDDWYNGNANYNRDTGIIEFYSSLTQDGHAGFTYTIEDREGAASYANVSIYFSNDAGESDEPAEDIPGDDLPDAPLPDDGNTPGENDPPPPIYNSIESDLKFRQAFGENSLIGMNLVGEVYFTGSDYYKDLMRAASPWITTDSTGTRYENDIYFAQIPKRSDGYPTHVPFNVSGTEEAQRLEMAISAGDRQNTGRFHVFYQGEGEFNIFGAQLIEEREPGHLIYDFGDVAGEKILRLNRSEISNPVRDIAIVHEDHAQDYRVAPFNPLLASSLDNISFVRLMDLMFTNGNAAVTENNIVPLDFYTWNDCPGSECDPSHYAGHPPEILMQLIAQLDVHPWITLPHMATDDFVREYAQRLFRLLDEDKFLIIEYSNELWNWLFPQTHWLGQQACADPTAKINLDDGSCDTETSSRRLQTKRSLEMFAIFKEEFGDRADKIITVLAGQGSWSARTELSLNALSDPTINPNNDRFDAIAIAPYFGGEIHFDTQEARDNFVAASFEQLRDDAFLSIDSDEVAGGIREHKALADRFGMQLIAYEGGQHYLCGQFCDDLEFTTKLAAFQRHDVMEEIYDHYYRTWFELGGSVFATFSHMGQADSRFGAWGTLEYYGQPLSETPKRRSLITATETYRLQSADENSTPGDNNQGEDSPVPDLADGGLPENDNLQNAIKRTYIFGHSLIVHEKLENDVPETKVPFWIEQFAAHAGYEFSASGQYGFLPQHANLAANVDSTPVEGFSPYPQWSFGETIWSEELGNNFAQVDFDSILLTAANFVQYQGPGSLYDGDNPRGLSPVTAALEIIDWVSQYEPEAQIYIYENWPESALATGSDDYLTFTQSQAVYHNYTRDRTENGFHHWWLDFHDAVIAERPDLNVKLIPVGPVLADLLLQEPYSAIPAQALYEDAAPHGTESLYFLASIVTYIAMYGEYPGSDIVIPDAVHPVIRENYADIVEYIAQRLISFNNEDGQNRLW